MEQLVCEGAFGSCHAHTSIAKAVSSMHTLPATAVIPSRNAAEQQYHTLFPQYFKAREIEIKQQ
jgi:hypothetical protein